MSFPNIINDFMYNRLTYRGIATEYLIGSADVLSILVDLKAWA